MIEDNDFDALDDLFYRKLANHQVPVDKAGWQKVQQGLGWPRRRAVVWLWSGGAVAAAVVLALFLLSGPFVGTKTPLDNSPQLAMEEPQQITDEFIDAISEVFEVDAATQKTERAVQVKTPTAVAIINDYPVELEVVAAPVSEVPVIEEPVPDVAPAAEHRQKAPVSDILGIEERLQKAHNLKKERKWTLAAAVGSSSGRSEGYSSQSKPNYNAGTTRGDDVRLTGNNQYASSLSASIQPFDNMSKSDYNVIRHLPPLSLGFTARTYMGGANIECGVVYTYLASRFSWTQSGVEYNVRQSLHYVGIPVNLVGYIWNKRPDWKIYFSLGVMVEKGLRGIYKQERLSTNRSTFTTIKSSIEGVQWSLNGAIGVSYRIKKDFSLYFEPKTGYFFDCTQPISMRTEWPFVIGFGIGVSYQLRDNH